MSTYITSDIHGRFDLYKKMLEKIRLKKDDKLFILGDVIDRGPQSIDILLDIMTRDNIYLLKGNHEQMMSEALDGITCSLYDWRNNGGATTEEQFFKLDSAKQESIKAFLKELPLFAIEGNNILVHAGIIKEKMVGDIEECLRNHTEDELLWTREQFIFRPTGLPEGYTVWFGHTPTSTIRGSDKRCTIWSDEYYEDKIGIDCGAFSEEYGQLACICLEKQSVCYFK